LAGEEQDGEVMVCLRMVEEVVVVVEQHLGTWLVVERRHRLQWYQVGLVPVEIWEVVVRRQMMVVEQTGLD
jgi:hypothetical protein